MINTYNNIIIIIITNVVLIIISLIRFPDLKKERENHQRRGSNQNYVPTTNAPPIKPLMYTLRL